MTFSSLVYLYLVVWEVIIMSENERLLNEWIIWLKENCLETSLQEVSNKKSLFSERIHHFKNRGYRVVEIQKREKLQMNIFELL